MINSKFLTPNTEKLTQLARYFPHYVYGEIVDPIHKIQEESWEKIDYSNTMLDFVFARAMKRFSDEKDSNKEHEHIYTKKFDIPQIQLFELLIKKYPMVNMTQQCTNTIIINYLKKWENAVLIDIGAGTGFQLRQILTLLDAEKDKITKKITVIAVEPFAPALETAKQNIEEVAAKVDYEINYVLKNAFAEKMSIDDWLDLVPPDSNHLIVNASFALHHIQSEIERLNVIEKMRYLPTEAIILSEPNVNHFEGNYYQRFKNCLHHFGLVFEVVDNLDVTPTEKNALKMFFSREIDDILGLPEDARVEKHYSTGQWLSTLQQAGFIPIKRDIHLPIEAVSNVSLNDSYYDFWSVRYHNEDMISVILAEPLEKMNM